MPNQSSIKQKKIRGNALAEEAEEKVNVFQCQKLTNGSSFSAMH